MVSLTFCESVVASTNTPCGGSFRFFSIGAQHVHFVENEHTMSTRVAHGSTLDELSNVGGTVVACSVHLEDIETGTPLDNQTRVKVITRLTLLRIDVIEELDQNSSS